jgi:hypothetical protein
LYFFGLKNFLISQLFFDLYFSRYILKASDDQFGPTAMETENESFIDRDGVRNVDFNAVNGE